MNHDHPAHMFVKSERPKFPFHVVLCNDNSCASLGRTLGLFGEASRFFGDGVRLFGGLPLMRFADVDGPGASSTATGPVTDFGGRPRPRPLLAFGVAFFGVEPPAFGGRPRPRFEPAGVGFLKVGYG